MWCLESIPILESPNSLLQRKNASSFSFPASRNYNPYKNWVILHPPIFHPTNQGELITAQPTLMRNRRVAIPMRQVYRPWPDLLGGATQKKGHITFPILPNTL